MRARPITALTGVLCAWLCVPCSGFAAPMRIVAAEGVYADIARQLAGPDAVVTAILTNPATDPHLFEPAPSTARAVAGAQLVIQNGLGYDAWMTRLLGASPARADGLIVVAALLHLHPGDNPHLWYDPAAMPALVAVLATHLARDHADPDGLELRQARLLGSLRALRARIDGLRRKLAGAPIAATEPVFGPMVQALGLQDTQARFQLAVMNGAEPRAGDIAAFQDDLRAHRVRALITNSQTSNPAVLRLVEIARQSAIPVVSVSETLPPGETYQAWLGAELDALEAALRQGRHA